MITTYWKQWSRDELMSMHVVKLDTSQHDRDDKIPEGEPEVCCSGCMYCLGFTWNDFM
jgi:hypothetical protein